MKRVQKVLFCFCFLVCISSLFSIEGSLGQDTRFLQEFIQNEQIDTKDEINNKPILSSSKTNYEIIQEIFSDKLSDYSSLGYFPQVYEPSLQATFYALYIYEVIEQLDQISVNDTIEFIMSCYNNTTNIFYDKYGYRYLDTDFSRTYYSLSTLLEVNCYAILSLDILNRLDLIDKQKSIDFIWSCYNPISSGFIGQPYSMDLHESFKISTMDNTYFAVMSLDLLMDDWSSYTVRKNELIQYINNLQDSVSIDWRYGGFYNDNNNTFDSLAPTKEPSLLSSYYCIKTLEVFEMGATINEISFHQFLDELYITNENYFEMSKLDHNYTNIVATAIGLDLSITTGYSSINQNAVTNFILNHRNHLNIWDSSTTVTMYELIDTFQIIRSLNSTGTISTFTSSEKTQIANATKNFYQFKGFSLTSKEYTSLKLINTIVSSFQLFDRISDLDIQNLYLLIRECFRQYNYPDNWYGFIDYINADPLKSGFRSYPIEYYNIGHRNYITEVDMVMTFKSLFFALDSMTKLFKLDDFKAEFGLEILINDIIQSQFLSDSYPEFYGAFLPMRGYSFFSYESQIKKIFFKYSYYAIKSLEVLVNHLNLGSIVNLSFNKGALYGYIERNIVETSSTLYFDPRYTSNVDIILQNTYYMIYILKALGLYDLNSQKIEEFVLQNINYNNINNIYYSYKISENLDLEIDFNLQLTGDLVKSLYSEDLKEFYISSDREIINQEIFLWICEMAKNSELEFICEYDESINLGSVNTISTSFRNLILSNFGPYTSVKFASSQFGVLILERQFDNTYQVNLMIPEDPSYYPYVEGDIKVYEGSKLIGQTLIFFKTRFEQSVNYTILKDKVRIKFEINISRKFNLEFQPVYNSTVSTDIFKDDIYLTTLNFSRKDYVSHSKFTLTYGYNELGKYFFNIVIVDDYYPNGQNILSYLQTISEPDHFELKVKGPILAGFSLAISASIMVATVKGGRWIKGKDKKEKQIDQGEKVKNEVQISDEDINDLKDSAFKDWG